MIAIFGFEFVTDTFSIVRTIFMPSITCPKTTCLPSNQSAGPQVIKNWQPLLLGPPSYDEKNHKFMITVGHRQKSSVCMF